MEAAQAAGDDNRRQAFGSVINVAEFVGDKAVLEGIADAFSADLARPAPLGQGDSSDDLMEIARAYAITGHRAKFVRAVAAAEASVARLARDWQPSRWLHIAQIYARVDDKANVDAAIAKSKAAGPLPKYDDGYYGFIAAAYAEAGDFKNAFDAVYTYVPDAAARTEPLAMIADLQARAGRYAEAEQTVGGIPDAFKKLRVHWLIVVQRMKTKQTAGLAEWIAAHPSSRERAVLYLAAACQSLGRENKGSAIIFRVR